ncbi:MAG: hypothetical protein HFI33_07485 [Lachnospiraceae bacterium]|nr:hypothetical protein [Lachnospiraceae bacterium]
MQDEYLEQIVRANKETGGGLSKGLFAAAVFFAAIGLLLYWPAIVLAIAAGVATWVVNNKKSQEYEYLYVNGELDIDVVKSWKRKRLGNFQMEQLECMMPKESLRLEGYKGRVKKSVDATTGSTGQPIFAMLFKQDQGYVQVWVEPEEELMAIFRRTVPSKILN